MPFYRIEYSPRNQLSGFGFNIRLPQEFPEFVKPLEFNHDDYEEFTERMLEVHQFKTRLRRGEYCGWQDGLLHHVQVPGNATGIAIDLAGIDRPIYLPDNVDTPVKMSVLLAVMTKYLTQVQAEHFRKHQQPA